MEDGRDWRTYVSGPQIKLTQKQIGKRSLILSLYQGDFTVTTGLCGSRRPPNHEPFRLTKSIKGPQYYHRIAPVAIDISNFPRTMVRTSIFSRRLLHSNTVGDPCVRLVALQSEANLLIKHSYDLNLIEYIQHRSGMLCTISEIYRRSNLNSFLVYIQVYVFSSFLPNVHI